MITKNENLGKFMVKNGKAYEGRVGFAKDEDGDQIACVKWYQIRGYRGAQIESSFRRENKRQIFGVEILEG